MKGYLPNTGEKYLDPDFVAAVKKSWARETTRPDCKDDWSEDNPALGQEFLTAFVIQVEYGFPISVHKVYTRSRLMDPLCRDYHFCNENDGVMDSPDSSIDITRSQYAKKITLLELGNTTNKTGYIRGEIEEESFVTRLQNFIDRMKENGFEMQTLSAQEMIKEFKFYHPNVFPPPAPQNRMPRL